MVSSLDFEYYTNTNNPTNENTNNPTNEKFVAFGVRFIHSWAVRDYVEEMTPN